MAVADPQFGNRHHSAHMSVETTTDKADTVKGRRLGRLRVVLLVIVLVVIAFAIYLFLPASVSTIQVKGELSANDVQAIRRGVTRWRDTDLSYSISHFRFGMFWDQVRVLHTCPLVTIASYDGKTGFAICQGRTWTGNQVNTVYMFTNTAGVWSGTTATRSEKK